MQNKMISDEKEFLKNYSIEDYDRPSIATDIVVLLKLLGIGVLLALVASAASVIFIMRYDPLKILANRD